MARRWIVFWFLVFSAGIGLMYWSYHVTAEAHPEAARLCANTPSWVNHHAPQASGCVRRITDWILTVQTQTPLLESTGDQFYKRLKPHAYLLEWFVLRGHEAGNRKTQ